ncbi:putative metal-binding motif-containing protein, partial [Myxococcota bacterium]|nr:putative metal-binding motif-containing protein [Myxococcota bacterium]MBU1509704.1 putative metal-binding motif-containing protein [Myxococcota bacterium]
MRIQSVFFLGLLFLVAACEGISYSNHNSNNTSNVNNANNINNVNNANNTNNTNNQTDPDVDDDLDGYTENQGDCDDLNPDIRPGIPEICGDGLDN